MSPTRIRVTATLTALAVALIGVVNALAAPGPNLYRASLVFAGAPGTVAQPAPLGLTETIHVASVTPDTRTGVLHRITMTVDGARLDPTGFPTCSATRIMRASSDRSCPRAALLATGTLTAALGPTADLAIAAGEACDPELHVWNGGRGTLVLFLVETAMHPCLGGVIATGEVPPWAGHYRELGDDLAVTVPIPYAVEDPLGASAMEVASLTRVDLDWSPHRVAGRADLQSTGCAGGERGYALGFESSAPSGAARANSVLGEAACR